MRTVRLGAALLATGAALALPGPVLAATPSFAGRVFVVAGAGSHVFGESDTATIRGEGEPASTAWLGTTVTTLARAADGSILVGTDGTLWRVGPDQRLARVRGGLRGAPTWADGTPAREPALNDVTGLAVTADGTVYASDEAGRALVAIGPDGAARHVPGPFCGPGPLLAPAGGGLLLGDCATVRELGPDGALTTLATATPGTRLTALAQAPDGTVLVTDPAGVIRRVDAVAGLPVAVDSLDHPGPLVTAAGVLLVGDAQDGRVVRVAPDGTRRTVFGARPTVGGRPDGARANDVALRGGIAGLLVLPDGSLLVADRSSPRVLMVASARPQTLALALCRRRCPPRGRVPVLATRGGTYALRVTDRVTGVVTTRAGRLPAGASLLATGGDVRHRRQLTVTLTGDDGQVTRQVRLLQAAAQP
jgi:membrane protein implicated in regulation of membrane protease activity